MIASIDHIALTVADIEATAEFYCRVLGMKRIIFAGERIALAFGRQKINLHQRGVGEKRAACPTPGSADLCFVADIPLGEVGAHLSANGVTLEEGPVLRKGANGPVTSIYFRDPDGNLIEVAEYG